MKSSISVCIIISLCLSLCSTSTYAENSALWFDDDFDEAINNLMDSIHIPSLSLGLVYENETIWTKGYGQLPYNDTIFMIGSISKVMTSIAVMTLYEQGLLNLTADINEYLPYSIRNPNWPDTPITVEMLLTHTASFPDHDTEQYGYITFEGICDVIPEEDCFPLIEHKPWPDWIQDYVNSSSTLYNYSSTGIVPFAKWEPGSQWTYSNFGYTLLGYIVELITDQTFEAYLQETIFDPLGMNSTSWTKTALDQSKHVDGNQKTLTDNYVIPPYDIETHGAGDIRSTVADISKILNMYMTGNSSILNSSTIEMIQRQHATMAPGAGYGYGWINAPGGRMFDSRVTRTFYGHDGVVPGYIAQIFYLKITDPKDTKYTEKPVGFIVFMNQQNDFTGEMVDIFDLFIEEAYNYISYPEGIPTTSKVSTKVTTTETTTSTPETNSASTPYVMGLGLLVLVLLPKIYIRRNQKII